MGDDGGGILARCGLLLIQFSRTRLRTPIWAQKVPTASAPALRMLHPKRCANSHIRNFCSAVVVVLVMGRFLLGARGPEADSTATSCAWGGRAVERPPEDSVGGAGACGRVSMGGGMIEDEPPVVIADEEPWTLAWFPAPPLPSLVILGGVSLLEFAGFDSTSSWPLPSSCV